MSAEYDLLDINSCTAEELQAFTGLTVDQARQIISYRDSVGAFYHLSELLETKVIDPKNFVNITGCDPNRVDGHLTRFNIKRLIKKHEGTDFTFKEITHLVSKMPTIAGAIICSDDGLPISSEVKAGVPADKISAAVSMCYKQFADALRNSEQSNLRMMTIDIENYTLSVFKEGKIYLLAVHQPNQFSHRVCEVIHQIVIEVSKSADTQKIKIPPR